MSKEKSQGQLLKEKLCISKKHAGLRLTSDEIKTCFDFCEDYKAFLNDAKIEREAVTKTITLAEKCGFKEFTYGMSLKAGDYVCATGTYVALPNSNDTEGALVCIVMKQTIQMKYKMMSDTAIEFTLVGDEESDKNMTAVGVAQDINIKVVTDGLANIIF